ncbi:MAG: TSUP family transporter [Actinobacteria bacterium]|nr:TSUP family transporter [Actinomycetota bacterium]
MELSLGLVLVVVLVGFAVGYFSALFGVGGGVIMVPFMVLVVGLTQHTAEGTSLLVIIPTAIIGVSVHLRKGFVSPAKGLLIGAGGVVGALLGASLALRIEEDSLTKTFALFVIVFGARTAFQGWKLRRAAS